MCMENSTIFCSLRSRSPLVFCIRSGFPPALLRRSSSSSSSTPLWQSRTVLLCVCVCAFCICGWGVCCHRYTKRSRRVVDLFFGKSTAQPSSHKSSTQQYSSGGTAAVVQRQPRSKLSPLCQSSQCYVRMAGAQQQEIEPRQRQHVQRNNQTHIVGPHTRYTKHTAAAKSVQLL